MPRTMVTFVPRSLLLLTPQLRESVRFRTTFVPFARTGASLLRAELRAVQRRVVAAFHVIAGAGSKIIGSERVATSVFRGVVKSTQVHLMVGP